MWKEAVRRECIKGTAAVVPVSSRERNTVVVEYASCPRFFVLVRLGDGSSSLPLGDRAIVSVRERAGLSRLGMRDCVAEAPQLFLQRGQILRNYYVPRKILSNQFIVLHQTPKHGKSPQRILLLHTFSVLLVLTP